MGEECEERTRCVERADQPKSDELLWTGKYFFSADRSTFEGEFVEDQMSGRGVLRFENGDTLEGVWYQDQLDGVVTCTEKSNQRQRTENWSKGERISAEEWRPLSGASSTAPSALSVVLLSPESSNDLEEVDISLN